MNLESFLLMRHEIVLTIVTLIILIAELSDAGKNRLIWISLASFFVVTVIGFLPVPEGSLFGDMYRSSHLTTMMKNILNIGVMILFLQTAGWIKKPEYDNKVSEFYMLILSTLIGMNFMISSGHFLMFYIGLELATIPIAALAAYDRFKSISSEAGIKLILSSALSSGIMLYGLSMIYGTAGSLYFTDVAVLVAQWTASGDGIYLFLCRYGIQDFTGTIPSLDS